MSGQEQDTLVLAIAANVSNEMRRQRVNVTELAAAAGTSERQVYRLLKAEHTPRVETIERFARALGKPASWFYVDRRKAAA